MIVNNIQLNKFLAKAQQAKASRRADVNYECGASMEYRYRLCPHLALDT